MVGELIPTPVDVKLAGPDFWRRFHQLRRIQHAELRADEPLEPDANVEVQMKREDPFEFQHTYEIAHGGVMLSRFRGSAVKPANPEYPSSKHLLWADVYVHPDHRRKGVATLWLPVIAHLMDMHGSTVLGMGAERDSGHAFLKWLGAEPKMTNIESLLKLAEVDWAMLERWAVEGARRSPDTTLSIYDGRVPEEMWSDYAPQLSALLNSMPWEGLDHGEIVMTPEKIQEWYERLELTGETQHIVITREPDGSISGITDVTWAAYRPRLLYQQFTGVRPEARGRGLGKWIKAAMLLHVRDLYPDLEAVLTENAHSNGPMLKINRTIGFKPSRTQVEYQIGRAVLEARIRSL